MTRNNNSETKTDKIYLCILPDIPIWIATGTRQSNQDAQRYEP